MSLSRLDIQNASSIRFNDIARLNLYELDLDLQRWVLLPRAQDLSINNAETHLEARLYTAQLLKGLIEEFLRLKRQEAAQAWVDKRIITRDMLTAGSNYTYLPFTNIVPPINRMPMTEFDYDMIVGSKPLANGFECTLIPNQGIDFGEAWVLGQEGLLMIRGIGYDQVFKRYYYLGSQLESNGNRTMNFANVGRDIYGNAISPMPDSGTRCFVRVGSTVQLEGADRGYTFSLISGVPQLEFTFDILDDQYVVVEVLTN